MPFALSPSVLSVLHSIAGPASVGVALSVAVMARLAAGTGAGARARALTWGMAGIGFATFLIYQVAVLTVLPQGNADLEVFYRAGREAAAGDEPYRYGGERVFLNPLPALGAFRLASALPYRWVANAWSVLNAALTLALVPLANRILARDHRDEPDAAPPALPADVAALLTAALLNANAALRGHRWGQLCALTAFALLLALGCRQRGRPAWAGLCLAIASFKPATAIPFLFLFLRKADRTAWISLAGVSLALAFAAAPVREWKSWTEDNLRQIGAAAEPGKVNDYDFPRDISADLVSFNQLFHRLGVRDRRAIAGLHNLAVVVVLAGLFAVRRRRPFSAVAALTAAGSMLVLYHRLYDAVILALPMTYGAATALRSSGRRRALALAGTGLMLLTIDLPREALIELTRWTLDHGLAGRLIQATILPLATWSLVLALLCLALCAFPERPEGTPDASGAETP